MLVLASRCYEIIKLGYLDTDIVPDKTRGPLLLELEAKPGRAIQIANDMRMQPRRAMIKSQLSMQRFTGERVAYLMRAFSRQNR